MHATQRVIHYPDVRQYAYTDGRLKFTTMPHDLNNLRDAVALNGRILQPHQSGSRARHHENQPEQ
jgi:hypothetical protein